MIKIKLNGNFNKTEKFMTKSFEITKIRNAKEFAKKCIEKLAEITPKDSGKTSNSWNYEIKNSKDGLRITLLNSNVQNGINVALLLEYGHLTKDGKWIEGKNFIEPAIFEIYNKAINDAWKELKGL